MLSIGDDKLLIKVIKPNEVIWQALQDPMLNVINCCSISTRKTETRILSSYRNCRIHLKKFAGDFSFKKWERHLESSPAEPRLQRRKVFNDRSIPDKFQNDQMIRYGTESLVNRFLLSCTFVVTSLVDKSKHMKICETREREDRKIRQFVSFHWRFFSQEFCLIESAWRCISALFDCWLLFTISLTVLAAIGIHRVRGKFNIGSGPARSVGPSCD